MIAKDKSMHIVDPRQPDAVMIVGAHMGSKAQRMQWKSASGLMITTGTSDFNDREYQVFDPRDFTKPLAKSILDQNNSVMWTYFDDVSNLFYVVNKGSTFT